MEYLSGWCKSKRQLDGITVVITGCNSGIGKETAFDMYERGARVIMACRDIQRAEQAKCDIISRSETKNGTLVIEELDLTKLKSVRECAHRILEREEKINILINNAGIMTHSLGKTEDGFETHMGVNHFGHAMFTLLLLPQIIKSAPSRIIFVSSSVHKRYDIDLGDINMENSTFGVMEAYGRSKSANVLFAKAIHLKLRENGITNVNTYSLHPGLVRTEIARDLFKKFVYVLASFFERFIGLFTKSPRCGAQTTIYCAVDENCEKQSGLYYSDCSVETSRICGYDSVAYKLYDLTIQLLKLQDYNPYGKTAPSDIVD